MMADRARRNALSAEWAAYGDALGFMTELADAGRVRHRVGSELVRDTVAWRRKLGGFNGVSVDLPAGSYSDDTQLRLSVSRAIRGDGGFDVAAFAKVELPAWSNYALGAGSASKEAASNLARTSATWYSNFFDGKRASYVRAGGNGAAMRVQPHVWAARDLTNLDPVLLDAVRDAVCTHGHLNGIIGACLHASTLAFAMREGRAAKLPEVRRMVDDLSGLPDLIARDGDLRLFWAGRWADSSETSLEAGVADVLDEAREDVRTLEAFEGQALAAAYPRAVEIVGALESDKRGSGLKTAILAAFAASLADTSDPKAALVTVANVLGSDTDSIATMAGALIGACAERACEDELQDRDYIRAEAERLAVIASGGTAKSFRYPDLRSWKPSRAAVDAISLADGRLFLDGLGQLEPVEGVRPVEIGGDVLRWCALPFGQTILARMRLSPQEAPSKRMGAQKPDGVTAKAVVARPPERLRDLFGGDGDRSGPTGPAGAREFEGATLNELLQRVIDAGFAPELIGRVLLHQVDVGGKDFVERGVALSANIVTAYQARAKRRRT